MTPAVARPDRPHVQDPPSSEGTRPGPVRARPGSPPAEGLRAPTLPPDRVVAEYFEYAENGVEVVQDGLKEMRFGEYLVERGAIDRYQLLLALQRQDREPGARLGECLAALGYLPDVDVERHLAAFWSVSVIELA